MNSSFQYPRSTAYLCIHNAPGSVKKSAAQLLAERDELSTPLAGSSVIVGSLNGQVVAGETYRGCHLRFSASGSRCTN
jgi:hypothetical protein